MVLTRASYRRGPWYARTYSSVVNWFGWWLGFWLLLAAIVESADEEAVGKVVTDTGDPSAMVSMCMSGLRGCGRPLSVCGTHLFGALVASETS